MDVLQNLGFVQIDDNRNEFLEKENLNEKISQYDYQTAGIRFSLDFLAGYDKTKKSLAERIDPKIELTESELLLTLRNFNTQKKVDEIQEVESNINEAKNTIEKSQTELNQIKPWEKLNFVPNEKVLPTDYNFQLVIIPEAVYENFINSLQEKIQLSAVEKINSTKKEIYAVIFYRRHDESRLNEIFNDLGIKPTDLPELEIKIADRIKELATAIDKNSEQIKYWEKKAEILAADQKELKLAYDYANWQKEKYQQLAKAGNTQQTFSLTGWVDKEKIKILEEQLNKVSTEYAIEELPISEEDNVPVEFNNGWAQPFEAVTNVYGAPMHNEPDPTPFLTPFFILFFGLCLTDGGYGIVLALASYLGLKFLKPSKEMKKMLTVLLWGGIATFFAGAAVGGWFGIVIDDIKTEWLRNLLVGLRAIDPVAEPIKMLIISLILGIFQILVGLLISIWWKVKNHRLKDALLDDATWLYFVTSLLVWGSHKIGLIDLAASVYLVYIGVAAIIFTQGRSSKNPLLRIVLGVVSLYGVVNYLSDVLSYSRLLALGLATGIIAMVINLIAALTIDLVPYVGYVIAFFIIIGGHIFNLAINALGAFIHSSRLQFVEFFPKFMEGGGAAFQPFAKESKYVRLNNNLNKK